MNDTLTVAQRAEAMEAKAIRELDEAIIVKSRLFLLADAEFSMPNGAKLQAEKPRREDADGRRPAPAENAGETNARRFLQMPLRPGAAPVAKRQARADRGAQREKMVLACLLHDIGVIGVRHPLHDHGY